MPVQIKGDKATRLPRCVNEITWHEDGPLARLYLDGPINSRNTRALRDHLERVVRNGCHTVVFFIDSPGGSTYHTLRLVDLIRHTRKKVDFHTCVTGRAFSGAAVLACLGHDRWVYKNASIMFHDVLTSFGDSMKLTDAIADTNETRRLSGRLRAILQEECPDLEDPLSRGDNYLNSAEALQVGLATAIGQPDYRVFVSVRVEAVHKKKRRLC